MVMQATVDLQKTYTVDEFMELDFPDDDYKYELLEGQIIMTPPPGDAHGRSTTRLAIYFGWYVLENDLGDVWTAGTFKFESNTGLTPDLAFVKSSRLPEATLKAVLLVPDLVIEIQSPSDTSNMVRRKVKRYQKAGVSLIWVVQPARKLVAVFHNNNNDEEPVTLQITDELSGEDIVPGFKMACRKIFEYKTAAPK